LLRDPDKRSEMDPQAIKALDMLKRAVALDEAGEYAAAKDLYVGGAEILHAASKRASDKSTRDLFFAKAAEYIGRAEVL